MSYPSKTQYLDSKVQTASQPQLHLMLLDGALRFGRQTKEAWTDEAESASADQFLVRMIDIVEELILGSDAGKEEGSKPLAEQYTFVYRELTACRINHDLTKLTSCLQLLEYQRETWKLACEKMAAEAATAKPRMPHMPMGTFQPSEGLSLEA